MIINILVCKDADIRKEVIDELTCLGCIKADSFTFPSLLNGVKLNAWYEYNNYLILLDNPTSEIMEDIESTINKNKKNIDTINFMVDTIETINMISSLFRINKIVFCRESYSTYYINEKDLPF